MKKLALHWWILIGMVAGIAYGLFSVQLEITWHVSEFIKPVGRLFLNLLKMIAVPLVLFSLVAGVASLRDMSKLGRIGGKTVGLYLGTTAVAITIGLIVVNLIGPGSGLSAETANQLRESFATQTSQRIESANEVNIVDQIVAMVPDNPFEALAETKMLQVVFFSLMLGIAMTRLPRDRSGHVIEVFQLLSDAIIEMVHIIMKIAPLGVFAMLAGVIADLGKNPDQMAELPGALVGYMLTVILGLFLHMVIVYTLLIRFVAKIPAWPFLRSLAPAQLLAFSSSSSAATLPVTMDCVEKRVGVEEEVSSFVLPLGATINMDGTGLYQGVAAVFIATVYQMDLTLGQQLQIVLTAALASIGTAAVPGVGIVMLVIVLKQINVPEAGIGLILGVDRILDMCRTTVNVTGDATVATVVAATEKALHPPKPMPTKE